MAPMVDPPQLSRRWPAVFGVAVSVLLLAGFAAMAAFFRQTDMYHAHFFSVERPLALCYNLARVGLGASLLLGCIGLGGVARAGLRLRAAAPVAATAVAPVADGLILDFFLGASLLGTFWYAAGLLGLLHPALALGVHGLCLALCGPRLATALRGLPARLRAAVGGLNPAQNGQGWGGAVSRLLLGALWLAAAGAIALNYSYNALVPGGTHDMYHHYFPYLLEVLEKGATMPGEVWYHFYYTKSQGLFFSASLLSDPLAPQVVSAVFVAGAGMCVYALLRTAFSPPHFAVLGLAAFNLACVTTAAWVFHQKNHVVMLGFFAWLLWHCARVWQGENRGWKARGPALAIACAFILNAPSAFAVALPFAGGMGLLALARRGRRADVWDYLAVCVGLGLGLAATFGLNQLLTGMAEINPFRVFWRHADVGRLAQWVSPYLMVTLEQGSGQGLGGISAPLAKLLFKPSYYMQILKPQHFTGLLFNLPEGLRLGVLALACLAFAGLPTRGDAAGRVLKRGWRELALPCLMLLAVTLGLGMVTRQGESYERFTGFVLMAEAVLLVLLWQMALSRAFLSGGWGRAAAGAMCLALTLLCGVDALCVHRILPRDQAMAARFVAGRASMAEVYANLGALWPPAHEVRAVMPPGARLRLMHVVHHSMAPYPPLETEFSFALGREWHVAAFAPAEEAKACLQRQGVDYFLVDRSEPLFDMLAHSPLFAQESLARNFRVAWRKGEVFLLTWARPGGAAAGSATPADMPGPGMSGADMADFLAGWQAHLDRSEKKVPLGELYRQVLAIYEYNGRDARRVALPPGLGTVRGWQ